MPGQISCFGFGVYLHMGRLEMSSCELDKTTANCGSMKTAWLIKLLLLLQTNVCRFNTLTVWLIRQGRVPCWHKWRVSSAMAPHLTALCLDSQPGRSHTQLEVMETSPLPQHCAVCLKPHWCTLCLPPCIPEDGRGAVWAAIPAKWEEGSFTEWDKPFCHWICVLLLVALSCPCPLLSRWEPEGASRQWLCN